MSHIESIEKEIRKGVADYISREASRKSLITITRCEISSDEKRAALFVSVLPDKAEPIAMDFLKRHQDLIRTHVQKNSRIRMVPWLRFTLDRGEKNRQLVDELLRDDVK
jgi:ribosome-binding factor A